jgi:hypothetical protein
MYNEGFSLVLIIKGGRSRTITRHFNGISMSLIEYAQYLLWSNNAEKRVDTFF